MNFIFIFISSSETNLLRKKSVKQKIKKRWPNCSFAVSISKILRLFLFSHAKQSGFESNLVGNTGDRFSCDNTYDCTMYRYLGRGPVPVGRTSLTSQN